MSTTFITNNKIINALLGKLSLKNFDYLEAINSSAHPAVFDLVNFKAELAAARPVGAQV